ncbi:hypothetical protein GCM10023198_59670 [Promicromonospora umidemergens]|uniref:Uncharacterized protein n=1 Tax=Promicromonospora umidemergens TaxID=629679 RepID=A0ABP8YCL0_9MICO
MKSFAREGDRAGGREGARTAGAASTASAGMLGTGSWDTSVVVMAPTLWVATDIPGESSTACRAPEGDRAVRFVR